MVRKVDRKKLFKGLFVIAFISFLISYIIEVSGYYEYNLQNRTILTSEAMKRFESDINEGKDVLLEDYVVSETKDYSTSLTRGTNRVSMGVNRALKKGIEGVFKIFGSFVSN